MEPVELEDALALIERGIREHPGEGLLPHASVQALDVLYHALVFTGASDALSIWRTALWERALSDRGRAAVTEMLDHLNREVQAGHDESVNSVCDCLTTIFSAAPGIQYLSAVPAGEH